MKGFDFSRARNRDLLRALVGVERERRREKRLRRLHRARESHLLLDCLLVLRERDERVAHHVGDDVAARHVGGGGELPRALNDAVVAFDERPRRRAVAEREEPLDERDLHEQGAPLVVERARPRDAGVVDGDEGAALRVEDARLAEAEVAVAVVVAQVEASRAAGVGEVEELLDLRGREEVISLERRRRLILPVRRVRVELQVAVVDVARRRHAVRAKDLGERTRRGDVRADVVAHHDLPILGVGGVIRVPEVQPPVEEPRLAGHAVARVAAPPAREHEIARIADLEIAREVAALALDALQLLDKPLDLLLRRVGDQRLGGDAPHLTLLAHGEAEAGNLRGPVNPIRSVARIAAAGVLDREIRAVAVIVPDFRATFFLHARVVEVGDA